MWKWAFASFFIAILLPALSVYAADYLSMMHPYVSLMQTYDDNINLTPNYKIKDGITTLQPGISFQNMKESGGLNFDVNMGQNWYWNESQTNFTSVNGTLDAKYMSSEHINLYLQEIFTRSNEPREEQYVVPVEFLYYNTVIKAYMLSVQQARFIYERNVVMPAVEYQFGKDDRIGLKYRNDAYNDQDPTVGKSQENYLNPYFSYWFDPQNSISGEYGFTRGDFQNDPNLEAHMGRLRYTNRPDPNLTVYTEYFYEYRNFDPPYLDYDIHEPRVGMTYNFSSTMQASLQVGYYWQKVQDGPGKNGPTYIASLTNLDKRTTYSLLMQGGYTEDYFTSQNLGFVRYYNFAASIMHSPEKHIHLGLSGNLGLVDQSNNQNETIYGITGTVGYDVLKWLTLSLVYTHQEEDSNIETSEYIDNRLMLTIKAIYL
jgi:hypothetical protein